MIDVLTQLVAKLGLSNEHKVDMDDVASLNQLVLPTLLVLHLSIWDEPRCSPGRQIGRLPPSFGQSRHKCVQKHLKAQVYDKIAINKHN